MFIGYVESGCKVCNPLIDLNYDELQYKQGPAITIKLPYVITYVCQNFGIRDVCGQIPKRIYQASYLLPIDFPNNFS